MYQIWEALWIQPRWYSYRAKVVSLCDQLKIQELESDSQKYLEANSKTHI